MRKDTKFTNLLLPPAILEYLKEQHGEVFDTSIIHEQHHNETRKRCIAGLYLDNDPWNTIIGLPIGATKVDGSVVKHPDEGHHWLNACARQCDLAGAYELIRLDHPIDYADDSGYTPLLDACRLLKKLRVDGFQKLLPPGYPKAYIETIKLLVLHHANVNIDVDGETPLLAMAAAEEWDLVTLLLQHCANPETPSISQGLHENLRPRFDLLVKLHHNKKSRPARLCPCHSGLTLDKCHDSAEARRGEKFWPTYAICPCSRSYGPMSGCCGKRGVEYFLFWKVHRLVHDRRMGSTSGSFSELMEGIQDPIAKSLLSTDALGTFINSNLLAGKAPSKKEMGDWLRPIVDVLVSENALDPAFAAVIRKFGYNLHPPDHAMPKDEKALNAKEWNQFAEEYIQSGVDPRPRREIEIVCKVNIDGGPMFRECESDDCSKREETASEFKLCSKCKSSVYCSRECQTSAWKTHKTVCGTKSQSQQWLPDSRIVHRRIVTNFGNRTYFW